MHFYSAQGLLLPGWLRPPTTRPAPVAHLRAEWSQRRFRALSSLGFGGFMQSVMRTVTKRKHLATKWMLWVSGFGSLVFGGLGLRGLGLACGHRGFLGPKESCRLRRDGLLNLGFRAWSSAWELQRCRSKNYPVANKPNC